MLTRNPSNSEFNEVQSSKRNTYRRKVAAAKKGVPYVDTPGLLREPRVPEATGPPGTTFIQDPAAAAGIDTSRSIKKQRLSAANTNGSNAEGGNPDDSAMSGVDADGTQEYQDAESEPDEPIEEDEDEDEEANEMDEEEDEEEEGGDEDEMHDALEEREDQNEEDEALDNGEDSDS